MQTDNLLTQMEHQLWALNQLLNQITKSYLTDKGLTVPRFWVLRRLRLETSMTMGELQRQMYLAPATLTQLVDALVEKGWVKRFRDEEDRRVVLLHLTQDGKALVDDVLDFRVAKLKAAVKGQDIDLTRFSSYVNMLFEHINRQVGPQ